MYLVNLWNPISLGADRGKMTSMESRVKVKRWSTYQGGRAGGALGRRKSHTGGKTGRGCSEPRTALTQWSEPWPWTPSCKDPW